jgi:predicted RecB family nuclease
MQRHGNQLLYSPSDLGNFVACEHLSQLELAVALGQSTRPTVSNAYLDLIKRKGEEHETAFLEGIRSEGHEIVEIGLTEDRGFAAAAEGTEAAMRFGAKYIYQAVFLADCWHGIADFLERIDRPSALGDWSYQVLDTKLARHPRPEHALQHIQGTAPEMACVVLGTRDRFPIRLANVAAYFRRLNRRFADAIVARVQPAPYPCEHCQMCSYQSICGERWEREDHLVRVAGIRRDQVNRLTIGGLTTLTALAQARPDTRVPKIPAATFEGLHDQAALQLETQRDGKIAYRELPVEDGRGFAALPQRSKGDVILDLEGHPFFEPARGLTFLFGVLTLDQQGPRYRPFWAHDFAGERRAFEEFIDFVHARLRDYPDLHVYHYGAYEQSALKQLMGLYATREDEVDDLLRRKIFVNLLSIFHQSLRAGVPSYSLKALEPLFGFTRIGTVRSGMDAIVEYERWRESQEQKFLEQIASYNEEDCRATLALLDWLHKLRPPELPWPALPEPRAISEEASEILDARQRLREEFVTSAEPGDYRWLAGELLEYHRREARPAWWWYFERCGMSSEELVEDAESIGCLEVEKNESPISQKRSLIYILKFPAQDHKLAPGSAHEPATGKSAGEILEIDDTTGMLKLLCGPKFAGTALPEALIPGGPYRDNDQRMALFRLAESIQKGDGRYAALEAILKRERPRIRGLSETELVHTINVDEMKSRALGLDSSYLFIQGPPGAGKTWAGARLIAHLLKIGKRVGVAAQSHKAIHNLLNEIEKFARETGLRFRGLKKSSGDNPESVYEGDFIKSEAQFDRFVGEASGVKLLAGTAWLFSRHELDRSLDVTSSSMRPDRWRWLMLSRWGPQRKISFSSAIRFNSRRYPRECIRRGAAHPFSSICSARRRRFRKIAASFLTKATGCIRMSASSSRRSSMPAGSTPMSQQLGERPIGTQGSASLPWSMMAIATPQTRRSQK